MPGRSRADPCSVQAALSISRALNVHRAGPRPAQPEIGTSVSSVKSADCLSLEAGSELKARVGSRDEIRRRCAYVVGADVATSGPTPGAWWRAGLRGWWSAKRARCCLPARRVHGSRHVGPRVSGLCRDFRVVRYDIRPFGESTRPEKPYSVPDDLLRLLDHLEIDRPISSATRSAARWRIDFALLHPDRVASLVLVVRTAERLRRRRKTSARPLAPSSPR